MVSAAVGTGTEGSLDEWLILVIGVNGGTWHFWWSVPIELTFFFSLAKADVTD